MKRHVCGSHNCREQHKFCEETQKLGTSPPGLFILVGGPHPYLNVHSNLRGVGASLYNMSEPRQLRRLANAILRTVKAPKRRPPAPNQKERR